MKKLKLNKQTISMLGNDMQKKIIGGEEATGYGPCPTFSQAPGCTMTILICYSAEDGNSMDGCKAKKTNYCN